MSVERPPLDQQHELAGIFDAAPHAPRFNAGHTAQPAQSTLGHRRREVDLPSRPSPQFRAFQHHYFFPSFSSFPTSHVPPSRSHPPSPAPPSPRTTPPLP